MLHHLTSTFELSKTMRFGAARGPITYEHWTEDNKKASVPLGVAIRIAARLEPLGRQLHQTYCNDSVIVAAGSFIEGLDDASKKEFEVRQISRTEMPDLDVDHEEKFIVIKTERDPPITTRLWS